MLFDIEIAARLCTGRVRRLQGDHVIVSLDGQDIPARVATPFYRPGLDDEVLIARQEPDCFVIGVLRIAGAARLMAPGDLQVCAAGALELVSAGQARLTAPKVSIEASALEVVARSVSERFGKARRWVRECFQLRAGRFRTDVDDVCETQAGRIVQRAARDVKIDGESIDLG
jgi:hypothetical protein